MKNIHVLPSPKPSILIFDREENRLLPLQDEPVFMEHQDLVENQNIYITSDEEIKEGDWCLSKLNEVVRFGKKFTASLYKKIVVTTDQTLIADGVQAIDDEFLEWFCSKNPSCESVEINSEKIHIGWEPDYSFEDKGIEGSKKSYQTFYKIIIPKEEPKEFDIRELNRLDDIEIEEMSNDWATMSQQIKPKQETLEEAAERLSKDAYKKHSLKDDTFSLNEQIQRSGGFIVGFTEGLKEGAKWQQEQDKNKYSEEEVINAFNEGQALNVRGKLIQGKEWFEQFKKK